MKSDLRVAASEKQASRAELTRRILAAGLAVLEQDRCEPARSFILDQLARNTNLLPDALSEAILSGVVPPRPDLTMHLIIAALDAYVAIANDPQSTWNDRRLSRQALAIAFLTAFSME